MTLNVADGRLSSDVFKAFDIPLTSCESSLLHFAFWSKWIGKGNASFLKSISGYFEISAASFAIFALLFSEKYG